MRSLKELHTLGLRLIYGYDDLPVSYSMLYGETKLTLEEIEFCGTVLRNDWKNIENARQVTINISLGSLISNMQIANPLDAEATGKRIADILKKSLE